MQVRKYEKIMFIDFSSDYGGGQQVYLKNIINRLNKKEFECWMVSNNPCGFFEKLNIGKNKCVKIPNMYSRFLYIKILINKIINENEIKNVVFNGNKAVYLAPFIKVNKKIVILHTMPSFNTGLKYYVYKILMKSILDYIVDKIIVLSYIQKEAMYSIGIKKNKMHVVYNGVDIQRFSGRKISEHNEIRIVEVANIEEHKGYNELVIVFNRLLKNYSNIKLWIIGTGDEKYVENLKLLVERMGISDRVIFFGYKENVEDFLQKSDIFVLPSYSECLPISLMEAMASSLPVVVSRVGGIPEIFTDGENGFMVEAKNQDDLYFRLECLVNDEILRNNIGINNYEKIKGKFSIEDCVNNIVKVIIK